MKLTWFNRNDDCSFVPKKIKVWLILQLTPHSSSMPSASPLFTASISLLILSFSKTLCNSFPNEQRKVKFCKMRTNKAEINTDVSL